MVKGIQNTAGRLLTGTYKYGHITPALPNISLLTSRTMNYIQNPAIYTQMLSWLSTRTPPGIAYMETVKKGLRSDLLIKHELPVFCES